MLLRALLNEVTRRLRTAGVPSPEVDARELLGHVTGLGRAALLTWGGALTDAQAARLEQLLRRREAREPLQHLLGEVEWGGLRLRVGPGALIPRPETEWLLQLVLEHLRDVPAPRVLDVGTGSGALALGLKAARPDAVVRASDLSPEALAWARENAALNGLDVPFVPGDLLAGCRGPLDLIVSNPPYLPESDRETAQPEVQHDPTLALYAGPDGLTVARRLAAQAGAALAPAGRLFLELDPRNVTTLADELAQQGWRSRLHSDLAGRERFLEAWLGSGGAAFSGADPTS